MCGTKSRLPVLGHLGRVDRVPASVRVQMQVHGVADEQQRGHVGPLLSAQPDHVLVEIHAVDDGPGLAQAARIAPQAQPTSSTRLPSSPSDSTNQRPYCRCQSPNPR